MAELNKAIDKLTYKLAMNYPYTADIAEKLIELGLIRQEKWLKAINDTKRFKDKILDKRNSNNKIEKSENTGENHDNNQDQK
ncbi:hypothetical protein D1T48_gp05 [Thermoproteus tenax virus 1]|uniref:Uncharacterized 9.5 kDa protein n=1 Tax=Thermoproteus tenax virus 1 (strain KRA1) TaxID=10480 RepID=YOR5_TTV1K|nr:hypothetical protein D1T48_gp05 [Thermoproteus tenax virus 1]P19280.1 RecName: Full=Uncharacterized 9.5 kDa protein [Thermoproteus tenax virus 1 (STRAIN KRA1)]CAA32973.1 unnamed protein product [Thermoproteus tenax virus 1]